MVQVIQRPRPDNKANYWWQQPTGTPKIHIHYVERSVFGNGVAGRVYGEMLIASGEIVYARELKLNSLEVLTFTEEYKRQDADKNYSAKKWIYHKGELDNWASIDVYDGAETWTAAGSLPSDGSIWLDFIAMGDVS